MKIAVEGCAHGELELIYRSLEELQRQNDIKIDLLLCCGDFQATRNLNDLETMAVPKKYREIGSFYKYYSGELEAPILTIFIGGNHEAMNYMQELPYGGWVAPNIYYMGYANVVRVKGIRIAGLSGIYKPSDYHYGHFEFSPYSEVTKRSVYHIRQLEIFRLKQLTGVIDIFMSHDWPRGIYEYGDKNQLLRFKPYFRPEVERGVLGNKPAEELLMHLKPSYWFAAHLHCQFAALVPHISDYNDDDVNDVKSKEVRYTKFLALDKCLPGRRFLQVIDINLSKEAEDKPLSIEYDLEWLTILNITNHLLGVRSIHYYMPEISINSSERVNFTPTTDELDYVRYRFKDDLQVPMNFCRVAVAYNKNDEAYPKEPAPQTNPQTVKLCTILGIDDPLTLAMIQHGRKPQTTIIEEDNTSRAPEHMATETSADSEDIVPIQDSTKSPDSHNKSSNTDELVVSNSSDSEPEEKEDNTSRDPEQMATETSANSEDIVPIQDSTKSPDSNNKLSNTDELVVSSSLDSEPKDSQGVIKKQESIHTETIGKILEIELINTNQNNSGTKEPDIVAHEPKNSEPGLRRRNAEVYKNLND